MRVRGGASRADIRLRAHGADLLEVVDNGAGIRPSDFDSLAKAHATSKLQSLHDFDKLLMFGFRGEALHALCALS